VFHPKSILLIQNFDFEDGKSQPKDKFLIVLLQTETDAIIAPLTSSQDFIPDYFNKGDRCIKDDPSCIHCYFFPKTLVIGLDGFAFNKDTYVYLNTSTLRKRRISSLTAKYQDTNSILIKDTLIDKEYRDFLHCIDKSDRVPRGVKRTIEPILKKLAKLKA
jgi:hypothetical protein